MKFAIGIVAGLLVGCVFGYWLHGTMTGPLGSGHIEERQFTRDVDLSSEYAFRPEKPLVSGVLKAGSRFYVDWRKTNEAVYVSFETVLVQNTIDQSSVLIRRH